MPTQWPRLIVFLPSQINFPCCHRPPVSSFHHPKIPSYGWLAADQLQRNRAKEHCGSCQRPENLERFPRTSFGPLSGLHASPSVVRKDQANKVRVCIVDTALVEKLCSTELHYNRLRKLKLLFDPLLIAEVVASFCCPSQSNGIL